MKTNEFLELLNDHKNKELLFEYTSGHFVGANYHITEIKNITVDSVDCGAGVDFWKETVIQLWESPTEKDKKEYMTAYKALGILNKVDCIKPMVKDAEVKFEYSNTSFHTTQLFVNEIIWNDSRLVVQLAVEKTDCKAKETCGVPVETEVSAQSNCAPGSGCC
ncbi:DUF6428 family protein [Croceitalea rosinachiae]|uniref:DUF6428 family protein n=1 Tax=Croceitalea rosinachiae TaxID=3075596 RepID=A0ABU3A7S4_9FLAO|nr:DUF6428 family protein [Croceitalea sp. F388]MDT0605870.1 DUF6428 family protein [Croceitalea sp. F388]